MNYGYFHIYRRRSVLITIRNYVKPASLEEAYELNQKRANRVIGGMMWLRMSRGNVNTAIDLSGLGLDEIEEDENSFHIGCMCTLRQIELHEGLNAAFGGMFKECVRHIVGVQFRNGATVGGSVFGRFGFSDVLTALLALDTSVKLYKKGVVPLADFVKQERDRDILEKIIIRKDGRRTVYLSERMSATDFPVLACAVSEKDGVYRVSIGARPMRAEAVETKDLEEAACGFRYGSNMRGSREYREHLAKVLVRRAENALKERNV